MWLLLPESFVENWATFYSNIWSHCSFNLSVAKHELWCKFYWPWLHKVLENDIGTSVTRFGNFLDFGHFLKPLAAINLPKSPTFAGKFCKGVNFYRHLAIFFWSHWLALFKQSFCSKCEESKTFYAQCVNVTLPKLYLTIQAQ